MNSNNLLKQILEEQKKTNELLKGGNEPIDIAINEPHEKMNGAPRRLYRVQAHSVQREEPETVGEEAEKERSPIEIIESVQKDVLEAMERAGGGLKNRPREITFISEAAQLYNKLRKLKQPIDAGLLGRITVGGVEITPEGIGTKNKEGEIKNRWDRSGVLDCRTGAPELAEPIFSADHIRTGTIKAEDLNEKLDKLSVLGMIDRYAIERADELIKTCARKSETLTEFKERILLDRRSNRPIPHNERILETAVADKIDEIIKATNQESRDVALNELFRKYKKEGTK